MSVHKILTVTDVADLLQVKPITVREMFREKRLRGFKMGKAWRTTETMLQEDIEALARGDSPAALSGAGDTAAANAESQEAGAYKTTDAAYPERGDAAQDRRAVAEDPAALEPSNGNASHDNASGRSAPDAAHEATDTTEAGVAPAKAPEAQADADASEDPAPAAALAPDNAPLEKKPAKRGKRKTPAAGAQEETKASDADAATTHGAADAEAVTNDTDNDDDADDDDSQQLLF